MEQLQTIWQHFSHLFFPHTCAGCGTDNLALQSPLCIHCLDQLPLTNFHLHAGNPAEKHFWGRLPVQAVSAFCHFTTGSLIQHLLHQLKYKGHKEAGYFLGSLMGHALRASVRFNTIEALVPLPLYAARERKRGYNQSQVLCTGIADVLQLPVLQGVVARLSATETQTRKSRMERWKNMEGKFELINPAAITGKHILLVDDVITTGATLEACGHELLKAGNIQLSIAALAYTV